MPIQCADIVFTSNATLLPAEECFNSTGISATALEGSAQATNTSDHNATSTGAASSSSSTGAASTVIVPSFLGLLVAGLAVL